MQTLDTETMHSLLMTLKRGQIFHIGMILMSSRENTSQK